VIRLAEEGELPNLNGVAALAVDDDTCHEEQIESFSSVLLLDLGADDPNAMPLDELDLLGLVFGSTYNELQVEQYCETLQRSVDSAIFELQSLRRRAITNEDIADMNDRA
jgi:hypothetical protein